MSWYQYCTIAQYLTKCNFSSTVRVIFLYLIFLIYMKAVLLQF